MPPVLRVVLTVRTPAAQPGGRRTIEKEEAGGGRKKEVERGNNGEAEMRSSEALRHPSLLEKPKG